MALGYGHTDPQASCNVCARDDPPHRQGQIQPHRVVPFWLEDDDTQPIETIGDCYTPNELRKREGLPPIEYAPPAGFELEPASSSLFFLYLMATSCIALLAAVWVLARWLG